MSYKCITKRITVLNVDRDYCNRWPDQSSVMIFVHRQDRLMRQTEMPSRLQEESRDKQNLSLYYSFGFI